MRLDANENPVYYLTDGMGSVIGLADGAGASTAKFGYDSFGQVRSSQGVAADSTGGDFRFQGQWLESATGIYNFRARDYDARTGTFLSRDPVDSTAQDPEAMNPYQAMYNNSYVYSDPNGMITINELNAASTIQNILEGLQKNFQRELTSRVIDEAKGVVTDVLLSALKQLTPFQTAGKLGDIAGDSVQQKISGKVANWEDILIENTICAILNSSPYADTVWKDVSININGEPQDDGYRCGENTPIDFKDSKPDFIIKRGGPKSTDGNPKAFLVGDAKLNAKSIKSGQKDKQFWAMVSYAEQKRGHQYVPVATYITIFGDEKNENKLKERALKRNVHLFVLDFFPQSDRK